MYSKRRYRQRHKPYSRNRMSDPSMYTTNPRVLNNSAAMSTPKNKFINVTPEMREYAWSQRTDNIQKIPLNYTATQNGVDAINAPYGKAFDPVTFTVNVPKDVLNIVFIEYNDVVQNINDSTFVAANSTYMVPANTLSISVRTDADRYVIRIRRNDTASSVDDTLTYDVYRLNYNLSSVRYVYIEDVDSTELFAMYVDDTLESITLSMQYFNIPAIA